MKKILDFISSKTFRNTFYFLVFTLLLTCAVSSQNYFFQRIIDNNVAMKDIPAYKDIKVVDVRKTEQHRKEVAQNVEPILTQAEDEFITANLASLQNSIIKIRKKEVSDSVKREEISVLFDNSNNIELVNFLLRASEEDLTYLFDKSKVVLTSVLNSGITYKDFDNNKVISIIRKHLPNLLYI